MRLIALLLSLSLFTCPVVYAGKSQTNKADLVAVEKSHSVASPASTYEKVLTVVVAGIVLYLLISDDGPAYRD